MLVNDLLDNGKSEACAFRFGGEIGVQDLISYLSRDSAAGIAY